jgi:hypothetical protein
MKPFLFTFETPGKQPIESKSSLAVSMDRVTDILIPKLKNIDINCDFHTIPELGSGIVLQLYSNKNKINSIFVIPWVRPPVLSINMLKSLADYPRLNIDKSAKHLTDEGKIEHMYKLIIKHRLHFLIMLPRIGNTDLYWFESYSTIPIELWKTTYRKDIKNLDRIHFPKYNKYNFTEIDVLKKKLNKAIKV